MTTSQTVFFTPITKGFYWAHLVFCLLCFITQLCLATMVRMISN